MAGDAIKTTLGGRVAHAAGLVGLTTPAALAKAVTDRGYSVSRQSVAALYRDAVDAPRRGLMETIAEIVDVSWEELTYGPRSGDSWLVAEIRGVEADLDDVQADRILFLAKDMAKETRARRESEEARAQAYITTLRGDRPDLAPLLDELSQRLAAQPAPAIQAPDTAAGAQPRRPGGRAQRA